MSQKIEITIDPQDYNYDGVHDITVEIDPSDYGLIDEDDALEYIDHKDALMEMSDDELLEELDEREKAFYTHGDTLAERVRKAIEKSSNDARVLLTDILGISHLASNEEIIDNLKRYL